MALERKVGGYVYRKTRRGRRIVSEYVGKGEYAALLWQADKHIKARTDEQRIAWVQERARIEAADALVGELARMAHSLMVESLHQAGYHQHKRQWRKKRDQY